MPFHKVNQAQTVMNNVASIDQRKRVDTRTVLQELFALLEDYGPVWYTEDHHNRVMAVLTEHS